MLRAQGLSLQVCFPFSSAWSEVLLSPSTSRWDYVTSESKTSLMISVSVPQEIDASNVTLDISTKQIAISCLAEEVLQIQLARPIDPARAPPAKFSKRSRQFTLELPFP